MLSSGRTNSFTPVAIATRSSILMKKASLLIVSIVGIAYPLVVYTGMQHMGVTGLATILLVFAAFRFFLTGKKTTLLWIAAGLICSFSLLIMALKSETLLRFYPVLVSVGVALAFLFSLWQDKTLIQRFAEMTGETITPVALRYMRLLTGWWVGLLLLNAVVASYTVFYTSLKTWTLYNGLVSYLIFGLFMILEWLYRQHYKRTREPGHAP